jgi:hypothetical protein
MPLDEACRRVAVALPRPSRFESRYAAVRVRGRDARIGRARRLVAEILHRGRVPVSGIDMHRRRSTWRGLADRIDGALAQMVELVIPHGDCIAVRASEDYASTTTRYRGVRVDWPALVAELAAAGVRLEPVPPDRTRPAQSSLDGGTGAGRVFIRGGWKPLHKHEQNFVGLPSRFGVGPFHFRFPIADRHTAYEWAMVLADRHPYAHPVKSLFGDIAGETIEGMQARERAIDGSEQAAGIFRDLKAEVEAGRLVPLRTERCCARPGIDTPNLPDFTRYLFGIDQVLLLVRRRGDAGWLIGKLLAASDRTSDELRFTAPPETKPLKRAPESEIHRAITEVYDAAAAKGEKPPNLKEIASPVRSFLRERGYEASGLPIQELASDLQHSGRRGKVGVTLSPKQRKPKPED